MDILVIGNGFDLAHGLPTKYTNFLEWAEELLEIGKELVWVDEIPIEERKVQNWLIDNKQPRNWEVKFDDKLIVDFLKANIMDKKTIYTKKRDKIEKWLEEHNIDILWLEEDFSPIPSYRKGKRVIRHDINTLNELDYNLKEALNKDRKEKIIKKENSTKSILEVINRIENREKSYLKVKEFFYKQLEEQTYNVSNVINKKLFSLVKDNSWIEYFLTNKNYIEENWIDFECEISKVIQGFDEIINGKMDNLISKYPCEFFKKYFENYKIKLQKEKIGLTGTNIREKLEKDLNNLICVLEIYLCEYVLKEEIEFISPDIRDLSVDCILSFNYTNTYERNYDVEKKKDYDYIHGKVKSNSDLKSNNMVLGIDEYLPENRKNKDVDFIVFKKFYQRIHKETGCKYKNWIQTIQNEYESYNKNKEFFEDLFKQSYNNPDISNLQLIYFAWLNNNNIKQKHNLYIFGHSLDITDKDIFKNLILNDNIHTTIYFRNKQQHGQQISNLVKIIGQDELIRRIGGNTKTIEFKLQQDMMKRDRNEKIL